MLDSDFDDDNSVQFKAGSVIYNYDDESDCAYFLKNGEVEIISKKGTTVGFINEDEVFGEQSILLDTKRTVTAKAFKRLLRIKIPKNTLLSEYRKSSSLIKAILRSTCIRLTNLDNSIHTSLKTKMTKYIFIQSICCLTFQRSFKYEHVLQVFEAEVNHQL